MTETILNYSTHYGNAVIGCCHSNYGCKTGDCWSTTECFYDRRHCNKWQHTITMSTTEAEFMALSATTEDIRLNKIVTVVGLSHVKTIPVYCDNNGANSLSKNNS